MCIFIHAISTEGVEYSNPESSRIDKEPSLPPIPAKPVWKPTSVLEDQVKTASPTACSHSNEHHSTVCQNQQQLGERESCSPPWDSVNVSLKRPMPVPRNRSINSAIQSSFETPSTSNTMSKPPAALPPHGDAVPSIGIFPAEDDMPPALPVKSALSREIQRSIKNKLQFSNEPQLPTKPYMSHENLDRNMSMKQNNSHGFQQIDLTSMSELTRDTADQLYIDPLQSQQLPSSGKPKPARPPPPSSSAIRKAQQRRARTPTSRPLKSSKSLTYHHSNLHSTMSTGLRKSNASNTPFSTSLSPSRSVLASKTAPQQDHYEVVDAEPRYPVYEELDDSTSPVHLSYPPPLHISSQGRRLSSISDTGTAPALPPRALKSGSKMQHRTKPTTKPIPSGFTQTHSGVDLPSIIETRHTSTPSKEWNDWEKEPEIDEDSVYEPVDASMPLPPQRTRKNIRGTRTTTSVSHNHNIHPKKNLSQKEDVGSVKSTPTPRKVLCSHSQQVNKLALTVTTPHSRLKTSRSIPGGAEEDFAAKLSRLSMQEDVRDVEGYVDMQCRIGWEEEGEKIKTRGCVCYNIAYTQT